VEGRDAAYLKFWVGGGGGGERKRGKPGGLTSFNRKKLGAESGGEFLRPRKVLDL